MPITLDTLPSSLRPPVWRQICNICACIVLAVFLFAYVRHQVYFFPITLETIWQLSLAETNRRKSKHRIATLKAELEPADIEKSSLGPAEYAPCLASVVGYREEPSLFTKCLESYKDCPGLKYMLIGIDGNEAQDMEMANVARNVYPDLVFVSLDEPLGITAVRLAEDYISRELELYEQLESELEWTLDDAPSELRRDAAAFAMDHVYRKAAEVLQNHGVLHMDQATSRVICTYQPHVSKKGIMFTNLVFSTVLSKANGIPFLWTSDSDTWVTPETIPLTVGCMVPDSKIGGSCSTLGIHNANDSIISLLGAAIYWTELAITRGQCGAIDSVDCQPGPCASFRVNALSPILFDWYTQTSMGIKTVVNEDRHLTTKLLLDGWKVTFNTEAIAFTDTPTTLLRYLLQQIRWARANQIETFQYPAVYGIHGPILFITAMNRFYGPLAVMTSVLRYVFHGDTSRAYSLYDIFLRIALVTAYNFYSNPRRVCGLGFLAFAQMFYQLPLPGIIVYASLTALERGWGTSMRNRKETQKAQGAGWQHLTSITAIACWMGLVAAALTRYLARLYIPAWQSPLMLLSATGCIAALYGGLLRRSQRA